MCAADNRTHANFRITSLLQWDGKKRAVPEQPDVPSYLGDIRLKGDDAMSDNKSTNQPSDSIKNFYNTWIKEVFGPIKDYFSVFHKVVSEPEQTSKELAEHKINPKLLVRAIIGGVIIAAAIDLISGMFFESANEGSYNIITSLLFMILIFIGAVIVHPPLKWMGGKAPFQQTFIANAMGAAVSPPISSLVLALVNLFGMTEDAVAYISSAILIPLLASVHEISKIKVATVLFVIPMAIFIIVTIIIISFAAILYLFS